MRLKAGIVISGIVISIVLVMFYSLFWYRFTSFYRSCIQIEIGMTDLQVENIMQSYMSDSRFDISRNGALWGSGLYIASKSSGNQCNISIKNGMVDKVEALFE